MNDAESEFKSLQEHNLWVANDHMKAKVLALSTVIGKLARKIDLKGYIKQSDKDLGNFPPSIGASGNNKNTIL